MSHRATGRASAASAGAADLQCSITPGWKPLRRLLVSLELPPPARLSCHHLADPPTALPAPARPGLHVQLLPRRPCHPQPRLLQRAAGRICACQATPVPAGKLGHGLGNLLGSKPQASGLAQHEASARSWPTHTHSPHQLHPSSSTLIHPPSPRPCTCCPPCGTAAPRWRLTPSATTPHSRHAPMLSR